MNNFNFNNPKSSSSKSEEQTASMNCQNKRNISLEDIFKAQKEMKPSDQFWKSFDRKWEQTKGKAVIASPVERLYSELSNVLVMALPRLQLLGAAFILLLGIAFYSLPKHQSNTQTLLASYFQPHENCQFVTKDLSVHSSPFVNHFSLASDEVGSYSKNDLTKAISAQGSGGEQIYQF